METELALLVRPPSWEHCPVPAPGAPRGGGLIRLQMLLGVTHCSHVVKTAFHKLWHLSFRYDWELRHISHFAICLHLCFPCLSDTMTTVSCSSVVIKPGGTEHTGARGFHTQLDEGPETP